jgi:hypothetical protein
MSRSFVENQSFLVYLAKRLQNYPTSRPPDHPIIRLHNYSSSIRSAENSEKVTLIPLLNHQSTIINAPNPEHNRQEGIDPRCFGLEEQ